MLKISRWDKGFKLTNKTGYRLIAFKFERKPEFLFSWRWQYLKILWLYVELELPKKDRKLGTLSIFLILFILSFLLGRILSNHI